MLASDGAVEHRDGDGRGEPSGDDGKAFQKVKHWRLRLGHQVERVEHASRVRDRELALAWVGAERQLRGVGGEFLGRVDADACGDRSSNRVRRADVAVTARDRQQHEAVACGGNVGSRSRRGGELEKWSGDDTDAEERETNDAEGKGAASGAGGSRHVESLGNSHATLSLFGFASPRLWLEARATRCQTSPSFCARTWSV